ncbi:MAG: Gx transporter family protein [Lachnospiraceae bacterium]|nr:Gx transporter family protein [Lachnospiraceae bacterium]
MRERKRWSRMSAKQVAMYGMFLAIALVAGYIEMMIPVNVGVPGVKLGLANIVTMLILYTIGPGPAILVTTLRIILSAILFGNAFAMVYSAAGAALSMTCMVILKRTKKFSPIGVSVAGGVCHNIGQIIVAVFVLETSALVYYLPILIVSGLGAGVVVGILSGILTKRLWPIIQQALE